MVRIPAPKSAFRRPAGPLLAVVPHDCRAPVGAISTAPGRVRGLESRNDANFKGRTMNHEGATSADLVADPRAQILRLRVSLKGRPVRSHSFTKDVITFGRDPEADIFLDNPGVSRAHLKIEKTPDGWYAEDLGSANGTSLNDVPLRRELLENEDVLRVGKFSVWVTLETDRRNAAVDKAPTDAPYQGTTVLSVAELDKMATKIRGFEEQAPPPPPLPVENSAGTRTVERLEVRRPVERTMVLVVVAVFVAGLGLGAAAVAILMH
jgi:hypothetical protein